MANPDGAGGVGGVWETVASGNLDQDPPATLEPGDYRYVIEIPFVAQMVIPGGVWPWLAARLRGVPGVTAATLVGSTLTVHFRVGG